MRQWGERLENKSEKGRNMSRGYVGFCFELFKGLSRG